MYNVLSNTVVTDILSLYPTPPAFISLANIRKYLNAFILCVTPLLMVIIIIRLWKISVGKKSVAITIIFIFTHSLENIHDTINFGRL